MIMIQVSHLQKKYDNGLLVLRDVNATIEKGEVISIIGPSGTGKSTFLRCLNLQKVVVMYLILMGRLLLFLQQNNLILKIGLIWVVMVEYLTLLFIGVHIQKHL